MVFSWNSNFRFWGYFLRFRKYFQRWGNFLVTSTIFLFKKHWFSVEIAIFWFREYFFRFQLLVKVWCVFSVEIIIFRFREYIFFGFSLFLALEGEEERLACWILIRLAGTWPSSTSKSSKSTFEQNLLSVKVLAGRSSLKALVRTRMRSLYTEGRRRQVNTTDMQTEQRACWQTTLQSNGQTYAPGTEGRGLAVAGQPSSPGRRRLAIAGCSRILRPAGSRAYTRSGSSHVRPLGVVPKSWLLMADRTADGEQGVDCRWNAVHPRLAEI